MRATKRTTRWWASSPARGTTRPRPRPPRARKSRARPDTDSSVAGAGVSRLPIPVQASAAPQQFSRPLTSFDSSTIVVDDCAIAPVVAGDSADAPVAGSPDGTVDTRAAGLDADQGNAGRGG